ncbi:TlpA disulfide reductase family protein [Maricaulis sp.]|jgi:thiol-disulfide isomerase/thioredoxin|uniref:TlpA family protein disulfide reductase n=1 Tax=Maricaulis sp. TaxID=1486257 RepID=UPI0026110F2B|nr:TlpA disulfide reductase family protein [Maricaulis sp.]
MKMSPLKAGLIAMPVFGLLAFLYVVFSAMDKGDAGGLDSYARGAMRNFVSRDDAPAQPDVAYVDENGEEVRLSDYRGQVILVNFWATWCGPCVEEMPALDRLQGELGGGDFQVVTVSLDRSMDDVLAFFERIDLEHLPIIHDTNLASFSRIQTPGLPTSILYDRQGRELGRVTAPAEWDSEDAKALIRAAIARGV